MLGGFCCFPLPMLTQFLAAFLKRLKQRTGARLGTVKSLFSKSKFLLSLALQSAIKMKRGAPKSHESLPGLLTF